MCSLFLPRASRAPGERNTCAGPSHPRIRSTPSAPQTYVNNTTTIIKISEFTILRTRVRSGKNGKTRSSVRKSSPSYPACRSYGRACIYNNRCFPSLVDRRPVCHDDNNITEFLRGRDAQRRRLFSYTLARRIDRPKSFPAILYVVVTATRLANERSFSRLSCVYSGKQYVYGTTAIPTGNAFCKN